MELYIYETRDGFEIAASAEDIPPRTMQDGLVWWVKQVAGPYYDHGLACVAAGKLRRKRGLLEVTVS